MKWLIGVCLLVAVALGVLGFWRSAGVRRVGRWLLGALFIAATGLTLAIVYLAVTTGSRGGGVFLFLAVVVGIVAWIFGRFFFASLDARRYYDLPTEGKIAENLQLADEIERHGSYEAQEFIAKTRPYVMNPKTYERDEPGP